MCPQETKPNLCQDRIEDRTKTVALLEIFSVLKKREEEDNLPLVYVKSSFWSPPTTTASNLYCTFALWSCNFRLPCTVPTQKLTEEQALEARQKDTQRSNHYCIVTQWVTRFDKMSHTFIWLIWHKLFTSYSCMLYILFYIFLCLFLPPWFTRYIS